MISYVFLSLQGPIINLPILPFTAHLASHARGMRRCIIFVALSGCIAAALRLVPEIIHPIHPQAVYFLHSAQILNAAAGPMVQVTVTMLSSTWFPASERTTSTSIAIISNNLGSAIGFILGPLVVSTGNDIPTLLYIHLGIAGLALLCTLIYLPIEPPTPPSHTAAVKHEEEEHMEEELEREAEEVEAHFHTLEPSSLPASHSHLALQSQLILQSNPPIPASNSHNHLTLPGQQSHRASRADESSSLVLSSSSPAPADSSSSHAAHTHGQHSTLLMLYLSALHTIRGFGLLLRNPSFLCLCISCGILNGVFNSWTGVLDTIVPPDFSQNQAGWFGFSATMANCLGGVIVGRITERTRLATKLLSVILILTSLSIIFTLWFLLSFDSIFTNSPVLQPNVMRVAAAITLTGLCVGSAAPISYELSAELTYPHPESLSAGLIFLFNNGSAIVFLFVAPAISGAAMDFIMLITCIACALLLIPIKEIYYRKMDEKRAQSKAAKKLAKRAEKSNGEKGERMSRALLNGGTKCDFCVHVVLCLYLFCLLAPAPLPPLIGSAEYNGVQIQQQE